MRPKRETESLPADAEHELQHELLGGRLEVIKNDAGEIIGEAVVYDNPSSMSAVEWAQNLEDHIAYRDPDCIAMYLKDGPMIAVDRDSIQEIRALEDRQLRMERLFGIAFKAIDSSVLAVTNSCVPSSSSPHDPQTPA